VEINFKISVESRCTNTDIGQLNGTINRGRRRRRWGDDMHYAV